MRRPMDNAGSQPRNFSVDYFTGMFYRNTVGRKNAKGGGMPGTILIVDNQPAQLRVMEEAVALRLRYGTVTSGGGAEAIEWVTSGREPCPDLVLLNLTLPEIEEFQVIRALRRCRSNLSIIVLRRFGDEGRSAAQAIQAGADDYLIKPVTLTRLRVSIANAIKWRRLAARVAQLERDALFPEKGPWTTGNMTGDGGEMLPMLDVRGRVKTLKVLEEEAIRFVLRRTGGSMTRTARNLGIGRSTLYRRLDELGIDSQGWQERPADDKASLRQRELVE